jgi:ubiquinone/menaquinone biosynthesis C-methylase UbiE
MLAGQSLSPMSTPRDVPARIAWAVEVLDVQPAEHILEVGCGPGVAAALIAARLRGGRLTAIDRSATALERAQRRNATHCAAGTLELVHASLAEFASPDNAFDRAFAINVNLFWTGGNAELHVVRRLLRPDGTLHLFYDPPAASRANTIRQRAAAVLGAAGFRIAHEQTRRLGTSLGLHLAVRTATQT